ncbi:MAG: Ig-like domain-containing protein [Bacteroidota bacterium]|nr:Ig-like domain-containing protein [Bacteroidota bacterium]MDX5469704.1 Ig-like domain-containing protein [Bacteroidota bacterium]
MKKILPLLLLFSACAVVVHPNGGDKDETPPKAERILPDSQTTSFAGKDIFIFFDEYFEIKDPNGILISPPPESKPKFTVVKKHLHIHFKEGLRDSTTYTVQLIDAIHDINEQNILPALSFSFSTGPNIDTTEFSGMVVDNLTKKPSASYSVALFPENVADIEDSLRLPSYITLTSSTGNFTIPSVNNKPYIICAFNDINHNYRVDPGENLGFINQPVFASDSIHIVTGEYAVAQIPQYFNPIPLDPHRFLLPIKAKKGQIPEIVPLSPSFDKSQFLHTEIKHRDTLLISDFIKNTEDTVATYLLRVNQQILDTITIPYPQAQIPTRIRLSARNSFAPKDSIHFISSHLLRATRPGYIKIYAQDSVEQPLKVQLSGHQLSLMSDLEHETTYKIIFLDSAARGYDEQFSSADTFLFTTSSPNKYGDAAILFQNTQNQEILVQLISNLESEAEYQTTTQGDSVYFANLNPGQYHIRLIYLDSIERPDEAIPFQRNMSRVYVNPLKINIRGGWTIGDFRLNNSEE